METTRALPKICVVVRKRPISKKEIQKNDVDIVEKRDTQAITVRECKCLLASTCIDSRSISPSTSRNTTSSSIRCSTKPRPTMMYTLPLGLVHSSTRPSSSPSYTPPFRAPR